MAWFVAWGIRVPAFAAGAVFLLAGAASVVDWSVALSGAALFGFLVEGAGHFGKRPRKPETKPVVVEESIDEKASVEHLIATLEEDEQSEDDAA